MVKEEELKVIELKVSVNCCEGCKRKVLKALSIKGVLKADIHPSLPRVTVVGSADVVTLVKKLAKCGKSAEILRVEQAKTSLSSSSSSESAKKEANSSEITKNVNEKDDKKSGSAEKKETTDNSSDSRCKCEKEKKGSKDESKAANDFTPSDGHHHDNLQKNIDPKVVTSMPAPMVASYARVYYPTEPMVYNYAMNSYPATTAPPTPLPCCARDHCCHCQPLQQQQMNTHPQGSAGFVDYFNDDNAAGCRVM